MGVKKERVTPARTTATIAVVRATRATNGRWHIDTQVKITATLPDGRLVNYCGPVSVGPVKQSGRKPRSKSKRPIRRRDA